MATQRSNFLVGPDELEVNKAVTDAIAYMDSNAVVRAVLDDPRVAACIDEDAFEHADLAKALAHAIPEAIDADAITDAIMASLGDLRSSSEPDSQLNPILDATALREQILANARVLHTLYLHVRPANYAEAEVIVAGGHVGKRFSAYVVRTRQLPGLKTDLAITMEVKGYKTHIEALEALLNLSRSKLTRAFETSKNMGGSLGNWELLDLR